MSIEVPTNFRVTTPLPLDDKLLAADIPARNGVPVEERYEGLMVYVQTTATLYQLQGGIGDIHWTDISSEATDLDGGAWI